MSLCLTKHNAMQVYWGVNVYIHVFLTSALDGGEWSVPNPCYFTPGKKDSITHWVQGWVGPTASLDDMEMENSWLYWDSNSYPSVVQPVAS
jgi:hypothetical protein